MHSFHTRKPHRGFTLLEVAVVLFIITLVMSGIVSFVNASLANRQIEVTRTKQEAIKTALITFITRNYRLPCPALATLPESAVNEGVEVLSSGGNCTGITASGSSPNQVVTGTVPWVSLGLTRESSLDAYANRYTYQVVLRATDPMLTNQTTVSGMTGRITVHSAGPGVIGVPPTVPTGNQTNDCSSGTTVNPCAGVALIVSHGKDGYGAYTRSGNQIAFEPAVTGNDARENANGDRMFVVKDYSGTDTNPFDDIVMVLTTNDLLSPLVIAGTLKDYRATLNAKIDVIKGAVIADAYNKGDADSGQRYYELQTSLPLLSSAQLTDPWNNQIIYQKDPGQTRVYCTDNPSQPAFSLTSRGPDGIAGNSDDIIYPVLSGEIINIIATVGCNK